MIATATSPVVRAAVDESIDAALERIRFRGSQVGGGVDALAEAITRAATGGKRFRPALVVAAFESFGGDLSKSPAVLPVAAAFELLHTAFVVHDDVIDHDTMRRGLPNVSGEFRQHGRANGADAAGAALLGDAAAILAGDLLLHEAGRLVALADTSAEIRHKLLTLLDDAVYVSAAGELADVEHAVIPVSADAAALLDVAHNKTAVYSFSAPLRAGGVLAGASRRAVDALEASGADLGVAFQLVDDLIGAFGSSEIAGRIEGGDLREAKQTPLIALARESVSWPRVSETLAMAATGPIAVRDAQRALDESGAPGRLMDLVHETLERAERAASSSALPSDTQALLHDIAGSIRERMP